MGRARPKESDSENVRKMKKQHDDLVARCRIMAYDDGLPWWYIVQKLAPYRSEQWVMDRILYRKDAHVDEADRDFAWMDGEDDGCDERY